MPGDSTRSRGRLAIGLAIALGTATPSPAADPLGDARLFFTRTERDRVAFAGAGDVEAEPNGGGSSERGRTGRDPTGRGPEPDRSDDRRVPARRAAASGSGEGGGVTAARRVRFDALLKVGGRIRVIVGGRPCHAHADAMGSELQCDRLPEGVESLALAPGGRRLVVTLGGGRRADVAVGEAIER